MGQSLSSSFPWCCSRTEADVKPYLKASKKNKKPKLNKKNKTKYAEKNFFDWISI